jgi:hypothetical protein
MQAEGLAAYGQKEQPYPNCGPPDSRIHDVASNPGGVLRKPEAHDILTLLVQMASGKSPWDSYDWVYQ